MKLGTRKARLETCLFENEAFFHAVYLNEFEVSHADLTPAFQEVAEAAQTARRVSSDSHTPDKRNGCHPQMTPVNGRTVTELLTLRDLYKVPDSRNAVMVELRGLDPLTPSMPSAGTQLIKVARVRLRLENVTGGRSESSPVAPAPVPSC